MSRSVSEFTTLLQIVLKLSTLTVITLMIVAKTKTITSHNSSSLIAKRIVRARAEIVVVEANAATEIVSEIALLHAEIIIVIEIETVEAVSAVVVKTTEMPEIEMPEM